MHIGIDLLFLHPTYSGGMETYARNLIHALSHVDRRNEYTLYVNRDAAGYFAKLPSNFSEHVVPIRANPVYLRFLYQQFYLSLSHGARRLNLIHSLGNVPIAWAACPRVVTVHDVIAERAPRDFERFRTAIRKLLLKAVGRRAWVVTVSETSRRDIVRLMGMPRSRVAVIPESCDSRFFGYTGTRDETVKRRYALPERYLLFVGRLYYYKNVPRILEALAILRREFSNLHLLLAGRAGHGLTEVNHTIRRLGLQDRVRFLEFVPDEDLPALYRRAEVFVFPSLYEGFGLPVLEALASGVPVVCSRAGSLPEVVGDSAVLVDPDDTGQWVAGIAQLLKDDQIAARLRSKGKERAGSFSWRETARATLDLYEEIAARHASLRCGSAPG